ncbi:MAG: peptide/nickel transport system permease protein [Solirubrobacteraceae bacterium]
MAIPLLVAVSALSFVLVSLTPGDAARQILGRDASPEAYPALRHALGLDLPLYEQYWHWVRSAVQGDLGTSLLNGDDVRDEIFTRLPVTLSLMIGALVISAIVGVSFGVFSALRGGVAGRAVDALALLGFAIPGFWLGLELIVLFAVKLRWLPATGYVAFGDSISGWSRSIALPVIALGLFCVASVAKQTRQAMVDVLGSEYIRVARANGISQRSLVFRHALRNASLPVLTVVGLHAVGLLGGTLVIENVFALPGLGTLAVNAALQHDLPTVQGVAVFFTMMVVIINVLVDLGYTWLNPRVRTG